jgi:hypothetical protein
MRRYLLDTGIAGDFIDRRRGVYEHARHEVARGNRVESRNRDEDARRARLASHPCPLQPEKHPAGRPNKRREPGAQRSTSCVAVFVPR